MAWDDDDIITSVLHNTDQLPLDTGAMVSGRAVTNILRVSPNGNSFDGSSWFKAFQTLQEALDAASTDVNECTLILMGINTGANYYDIDTTGDPTWTGNYIIQGSHRTWVKIKNDHASATSIAKFTGYVSLNDLNFNLGTGNNNGVIITKGAFRVRHTQFVGESLTGAATALHIDGATVLKHGRIEDTHFLGHVTHMKALLLDKAARNVIKNVQIHECLTGIQIVDGDSDENTFDHVDIGGCALGLDLDAGNVQHFCCIEFHSNTTNVDDEVGDHLWSDIKGNFPITSNPEDVTGITVAAHANADTWGTDTQLIAAAAIDAPFRIVGYCTVPVVAQNHLIRFSADSGSTFFDEICVSSARSVGSSFPSGTEFIFNKDTRISCSVMAESGGSDEVKAWVKLQEI